MSGIVDLTGDSSPFREPLPSNNILPDAATVSNQQRPGMRMLHPALRTAIDTLELRTIRDLLKKLCLIDPSLASTVEKELLIQGKDVVRYNTESEDDDETSDEEEEEEEEDDDSDGEEEAPISSKQEKRERPIGVPNSTFTPRNAKCLNCKQEFDLSYNPKGDCIWHFGTKEVDNDSDFWADHDEDCHGAIDSFEDDPDYAEGFIWSCWEKTADEEGCKSTRHKAHTNRTSMAVPGHSASMALKSKAVEELSRQPRNVRSVYLGP